jgi:hypothetical protein
MNVTSLRYLDLYFSYIYTCRFLISSLVVLVFRVLDITVSDSPSVPVPLTAFRCLFDKGLVHVTLSPDINVSAWSMAMAQVVTLDSAFSLHERRFLCDDRPIMHETMLRGLRRRSQPRPDSWFHVPILIDIAPAMNIVHLALVTEELRRVGRHIE